MTQELMLGAVAYDPKVVPIWEGIREYFRGAPVEMDVVLVLELRGAGQRAPRREDRHRVEHEPGVRADVSTRPHGDLPGPRDARHGRRRSSRSSSGGTGTFAERRATCEGRTLALGSADSAQAAIMPVHYLRAKGLASGEDVTLLRFDSDVGKHGDTGRSEREALAAVLDGRADVAAVGAASWDVFVRTGRGASRRARAVLDVAAVLRTATSRRCRRWTPRRRMRGSTHLRAMDWGEPGAPPASSSSRGSANGCGPNSTATRTCSPRSRSRGSRLDGERAGADDEPSRGYDGESSRALAGGTDVRARRLPVRHRGRARSWSSRARTPGSSTSSRRGAAEPGHELVASEPDGDRDAVPDPPRATARR